METAETVTRLRCEVEQAGSHLYRVHDTTDDDLGILLPPRHERRVV